MNDELSIQEVCERLNFAASTVMLMCAKGDFPGAYQDERQQWHIPTATVQAWQKNKSSQHINVPRWQLVRRFFTRKRLVALLVALGTAVLMILRMLAGSGFFSR
jgi:hypothetical protein